MQSLETDGTLEAHIIPAPARSAGLSRCFAYHGRSMIPTLRTGQILYVRTSAQDIVPGDVVVFADQTGNGYAVHRVVSIRDDGLIARGDNNWHNDGHFVALDQVIGRVEMLEDQGHLKRLQGGKRGLWLARIGWGARRAAVWLRRILRAPYRALRRSSMIRRILRGWLSRQLKVVRLETADGPLLKTIYKGQTIARWWPQLNRFECRKPYDLFVLPPDDLE